MEMAKYIMSILRTQITVAWSWGLHNPVAVTSGLRFAVQGFKFKGIVEVVYDEGYDLFKVSFIKAGKVVETVEGVYADSLIDIIDNHVERTDEYEKTVSDYYKLNLINSVNA